MLRVTNVIVTAFVAVCLFNSQYQYGGVGMVAAATLGGGGGEEVDTTTRGTMMTTVVDGLPVATRKLFKRSKASKPDADEPMLEQLWRALFLAKAMAMHRWKQQSVLTDASRAGEKNDGHGRELSLRQKYAYASCEECVEYFESQMQVSANEQEEFCRTTVENYNFEWGDKASDSKTKGQQITCLDVVQCPLRTNGTPSLCCRVLGKCQDQPHNCKLSLESGSYENYWIETETQAECDTESKAIGCGSCKNQATSDTILEQASMPLDGFVSYCAGGPCLWKPMTHQCMGLKYHPALTTPKACKDACCNDYTCAVWQFDANGYRDQCWYGTNCNTIGDIDSASYSWTYGGIRYMGTDQAPSCVRPTGQCASDYKSNYACCNQKGGYVDFEYQCPKSKPTCVDYVYKERWGRCEYVQPTGQCAGDYDSNDPCCDQTDDYGPVAPQFQCPQSKPTCVDYVYNDHFGYCE